MQDELARANELGSEATRLLEATGLLTLLSRYGEVHVTGSYYYDLMTWRDIDLCLAVKRVQTQTVFDLGREIADLPSVGSMYYRNEFVMETPSNPRAVFWCVDFYQPADTKWKVDVLISTHDEVAQVLSPGEALKKRLSPQEREDILRIKSVLCQRPGYREEFGSTSIYQAVLEHGISTVEDWDSWWKSKDV
jgi:hypothetical protein